MTVITMASSKGGCGKSTATVVLAGAFAAQGYNVCVIDADRAARLMDWASANELPSNITVMAAATDNIAPIIKDTSARYDVVLIDQEGTANRSSLVAAGMGDLTLIPANPSAPDVGDAKKTVLALREVEHLTGKPLIHGLIWSRVPHVRSTEMKLLEQDIADAGIPIIGSIHQRTIYSALFSYSTVLERLDPKQPGLEKALAESQALANAVTAMITGSQAAAA